MKLATCIPVILSLLAAPAAAQSKSKLKKELKTMEKAAKKDPDQLFAAGEWAKDNGLEKEAEKIFKRVIKFDKGHAGANLALGNEEVDGVWMPAKQAQKLRAKALGLTDSLHFRAARISELKDFNEEHTRKDYSCAYCCSTEDEIGKVLGDTWRFTGSLSVNSSPRVRERSRKFGTRSGVVAPLHAMETWFALM